ncbi:hypothetical protein [Flavobacterium hydatis]|uniref:Uncharacterized protein n=1 Tax=Flavobacterium hydatis TaxID=991 RepID=A0A086ANZ5_FLAHY|nr:hypothetical protein [Flavobacterium hydatis]KFF18409.1 hypothetical protein IW20_05800 [Flavobacterium hydatis]OXA96843.1 hypothetical protein B0A62_06215 [Flavobacterium hydatis]
MIENLIERTQTYDFYQNCNLKLDSFSFKTSDNTLEMIFSINQTSYDIPIEYEEWKITCSNTEKYDGFFWSILLPYTKLIILDSHPALIMYQLNELQCEIAGIPENINEFIGDISIILEKETGNWITVTDILWNIEEHYKLYNKRNIRIPKSLNHAIKEVCVKHNLLFKVNNEVIGGDKGYSHKSKSKILIFGNEDVSPNDFYLNQPYVIAESFTAERIR